MIEIKMPKDIRGYTEKLVAGLSLRQLIATVLCGGIGVGMYFIFRDTFLNDWLFVLIVAPIIPVGVWGFVRPQGMSAEKYIGHVLQSTVLWPEKRYYATENFYEDLCKEMNREKEEALIAEKQKKKAAKKKKK